MYSCSLFPLLYADVKLHNLHIMRHQGETTFIMDIAGKDESIEAPFVAMDPVQDGFCGLLVEYVALGKSYAVVETAVSTGN